MLKKLLIMATKNISILYLDDEKENLTSFSANFRREFNLFVASSIEEAYSIIESNEIHVVLSDHKMPHITGVEFFETLSKTHPTIVRILLTGCSDLEIAVESVNRGQIFKFLYKPMDIGLVKKTMILAYDKYMADKRNQQEVIDLIETNEKLEFMLRQKLIS
ncbi:MAG: response regulator [Flavobacteriales bacterium]|nr:response regulator [Flavobacteriales bacterium]